MTRAQVSACLAAALGGAFAMAAETNPIAHPAAVVQTAHARFTILTPRLVRMEWSPEGRFENRASHAFVHRATPVPTFQHGTEGQRTTITTDAFRLVYTDDGQPFAPGNLQISFDTAGRTGTWKPGQKNAGDLRGTWRTLDGVSGPSNLEQGILSREGWTLIDDSDRLLFDNSDWAWAVPRQDDEALDWYFFAYGHDYPTALQDFTLVAGRIPLPPKYTFGAWWSRYWAYSQQELRQLATDFQENNVPLDVLVIDMDWHLDGWTGYTWNPDYFPDPEGFLRWTAEQNLKVPLNLHPADGVGRHERAFPQVAAAMGLDPATTEKIPFDCTDPAYVEAYFKYLHAPLEKQGIDFWWMDWQQGTDSKIPGLDPLFWLNYLHWTHWERDSGAKAERPLVFSRWGGLGNHRYPVGFSGDTYCDWQSLAFQPYFTANAGNVGYGYWSHDIGGHQPGPVDPELYLRWIQWGAFSPVLRTHTTKNPLAERRIWAFDEEFFEPMRDAWQLRYRMMPYIYAMARRTTDTSLPLCRPLYYHWPELDEAYQHPEAYLFGDDLYVAPVATPANPRNRCATISVWLPPGDWVHWFSGRQYRGNTSHELLVPRHEMPLFVRAGAIIPQATLARTTSDITDGHRRLLVFAGSDGSTELYDDDGLSQGYTRGESMRTTVSSRREASDQTVRIGPGQGSYEGRPLARSYEVVLRDTLPPQSVSLDGSDLPRITPDDTHRGWFYDTRRLSTVIRTLALPLDREHNIVVRHRTHERLDTYLARGLRGQVSLGRQIDEAVARLAPPPIEQLAEIGQRINDNPDKAADELDHTTRVIYRVAAAIQKVNPDNAELAEFVARLIGYRARLDLEPGQTPGTLLAVARLGTGPGLGNTATIRRKIDFLAPDNWHAAAPSQASSRTPDGDEILTMRTELRGRHEDVLQPARLAAELTIDDDAAHLVLPVAIDLLPSINAWWLAGPFEREGMDDLDAGFAALTEIEQDESWTGKDGRQVGWRPWVREITPHQDLTTEFFVNFTDVYEGRVYDTVAYAMIFLHSPDARTAQIALGSDDGVRVWLNGTRVHDNQVGRAYSPRQDRFPVELRAGRNVLCIRIDQQGGDWAFGAHLETTDGAPMRDVEVRLK